MITKKALKRYIDIAISKAIKRYTDAFDWNSFVMKISDIVIGPLVQIAHNSPDRMASLGAIKALEPAKDAMRMSEQIAGRIAAKKSNEGSIALIKFGESKKIDVLSALRSVFDTAKQYATKAKAVPSESRKLFGVGQNALKLMAYLQASGKDFVPKSETTAKTISNSSAQETVSKTSQRVKDLIHFMIKRGKLIKSNGSLVNPSGNEVMTIKEAMDAVNGRMSPSMLNELLNKLSKI